MTHQKRLAPSSEILGRHLKRSVPRSEIPIGYQAKRLKVHPYADIHDAAHAFLAQAIAQAKNQEEREIQDVAAILASMRQEKRKAGGIEGGTATTLVSITPVRSTSAPAGLSSLVPDTEHKSAMYHNMSIPAIVLDTGAQSILNYNKLAVQRNGLEPYHAVPMNKQDSRSWYIEILEQITSNEGLRQALDRIEQEPSGGTDITHVKCALNNIVRVKEAVEQSLAHYAVNNQSKEKSKEALQRLLAWICITSSTLAEAATHFDAISHKRQGETPSKAGFASLAHRAREAQGEFNALGGTFAQVL